MLILFGIWAWPAHAMEQTVATKQKKLKELQTTNDTLTKNIEAYQQATNDLYAKAENNIITNLLTNIYKIPMLQTETSIISAQTKILEHKQKAPVLEKEIRDLTTEITNLKKAVATQSPDLVKKLLLKNIELYTTTIEKMLDPKYVTIQNQKNKPGANRYEWYKANRLRLNVLNGLTYEDQEIGIHRENKYTKLSKEAEPLLQKIYKKIKDIEAALPYPEKEKNPQYSWTSIGIYNNLIYRFPPKNWIPPKNWNLPEKWAISFYPPEGWKPEQGWTLPQGWVQSKEKK